MEVRHVRAFVCAAASLLLVMVFLAPFRPYAAGAIPPAELLVNGSFDKDLSGSSLADTDTTLYGWTISTQTYGLCVGTSPVRWTQSNPGGLSITAYDGGAARLNACGGPTNKPTVSQTVAVDPGAIYSITGVVHTGYYGADFSSFNVLVNGVSQAITYGSAVNGWTSFSALFTAASSSVVVGFVAEVLSDWDYAIDALSLVLDTPAPTTTPSSTTTTSTTTAPATSTTAAPTTTSTTSTTSTSTTALPTTTTSSTVVNSVAPQNPVVATSPSTTVDRGMVQSADASYPVTGADTRALMLCALMLIWAGASSLWVRRALTAAREVDEWQ